MSEIKNIIIQSIKEYDPDIDVSEGSNYNDVVITPLSVVLSSFYNDHKRITEYQRLKSIDTLDDLELEAIASTYLISRYSGSFGTGKVRFYYTSPQAVSIPTGTILTNSLTGIQYRTTNAFSASRLSMSTNVIDGLYATDEITVASYNRDANSSLPVGSRLTVASRSSATPSKIEVTDAIVGGETRETNADLRTRILNKLGSGSMISENSLDLRVKAEKPSVLKTIVVGADSPFMKRDLLEFDELATRTVETFEYIFSGMFNSPYSKGHVAYVDNFPISDVFDGTTFTFPELNRFSTEFTDEMYEGIFKLDNTVSATIDHNNIFTTFSFDEAALAQFDKADGQSASNSLIFTDEIRISDSKLILGKTQLPGESAIIRLSQSVLEQLRISLAELETSGMESLPGIQQTLEDIQKPDFYNNLSPIVHKTISQHTGVTITTRISTTDKSEDPQVCYITVLRNNEIFMPHDGYGVAWSKQPEFLIRLNYDDYGVGQESLRAADIEKFKALFNVDPVAEDLIGDDKLRTQAGNEDYWMYNIYLVDNNALSSEVTFGTNKIFDQINGVNQFLQKSKMWIESHYDYDIILKIWPTLATKVWVKLASEPEYELVIDKGATYPNYVPAAGSTIVTGNSSIDQLDASRGNFGIGVQNTRGYEWLVSSLAIRSFVENLPMHLFRFKIDLDKWSAADADFAVEYYGVGYDPVQYAYSGNTGNSRAIAAIYNYSTEAWETMGTTTGTISFATPDADKLITVEKQNISNYIDAEGFLNVVASPYNVGAEYSTNTEHFLRSYYICLINPESGQKHLNNAIDIYCHDPLELEVIEEVLTVTDSKIRLTSEYIQDIIEVRETLSQIGLPTQDYKIVCVKKGEAYSADNHIELKFDPADNGMSVTVILRRWKTGNLLNSYLTSPENRYPGSSIKEKIMPPAIIRIDKLEYSGELDEEEAKLAIVSYINNIPDFTFDKSDLINTLYTAGATFVDLDIEVFVKLYDPYFNNATYEITSSRYIIPTNTIAMFYTDIDNLQGVVRV